MPILCPKCSKANPSGSLSCVHCGAPLPPDSAVSKSVPEPPAHDEPAEPALDREKAEKAKANAHAEFMAAASMASEDWLPLSELRLWGCITVLVPVAGLVVGLFWLLRRQRGGGCFLVLAVLTNILYGALILVAVSSVTEGRLIESRIAGLRGIYEAERAYFQMYEVFGDFEELQEEGLIAAELDIVVEDERNATDAFGTRYYQESLSDDGFVVVGRHERLSSEHRVSETGFALTEADSGGA